jgi:hypothetical protein
MLNYNFSEIFPNFPSENSNGKVKILFHRISTSEKIIHRWIDGSFEINKKTISVSHKKIPLPNGLYRPLAIKFFKIDELKHFFSITNPANFSTSDFKIINNIYYLANKKEIDIEIKNWDKKIRIGNPDSMKKWKYSDVTFICSNALISTPVRIGNAELYPISRGGIVDLSSSIQEAFLHQGIRTIKFNEIVEGLEKLNDRKSPLFSIRFPRVYIESESLTLPLIPYLKKIFGILCLNRGAYCQVLGGIHLQQKEGFKNVHYMNLNSYYRGNLISGIIAGEKHDLWNIQYEKLKQDSFKSEIVNKLNSAYAEDDLDISYFRLWAILESITFDLTNRKDLKSIKNIIRMSYPNENTNSIKLSLGDFNLSFDELAVFWINWRDITAHHGGIFAFLEGKKKVNKHIKEFITVMLKNNKTIAYGDDYANIILKEVCSNVVKSYINDELN